MTVEGALSTRGHLLDTHSTLCTAVPHPSSPDMNQPSSLENTLLDSHPLCAAGGSYIDETANDSWVNFTHIDNDHDVDNQASMQCTQPEQVDIAASNIFFGEDEDLLFSNENIGGEAHAGDLNIDLDGEFVILLPFLAAEYF